MNFAKRAAAVTACLGMLLPFQAWSDDQTGDGTTPTLTPEQEKALQARVAFENSLVYQTGTIPLGEDLATLRLPDSLRYLDPNHTKRLLETGWGNPDGSGTLGMILPAATNPLAAGGWGVVVTYEEDGYVSDEDADGINYDELLKDMQESTDDAAKARTSQGLGAIKLVGWAERPSYDKATHKLLWAKEVNFDGMDTNTLNYNIRMLGRRGVLVLNAVSSMEQMATVKQSMPGIMTATEFNGGNRYTDYKPGMDKIAAYGLAALVAGGVAAKTGLITKLVGMVLAAKKILIPLFIFAFAGISRLLKRRGGAADDAPSGG